MLGETPFLERFAAASRAGFTAVEFLLPYGWDTRELADRLARYPLTPVLHNLPAGDWDRGDRGLACLPDRRGEFQDSVGLAIDYATALGCSRLNCLAGIAPPGIPREALVDTLVENLRFAAPRLADAGITLLVEPINGRDMPGYFLNRLTEAVDILDVAAVDNLFLQADLYHMHMMGEDVPHLIALHLPRIRHIQIADCPGRHEPGTGTIDFDGLFHQIDAAGYEGWIGCEYRPASTTEAGLGWLARYRSGTLS
jgi:hydroxypyruvate isomerase